LEPGTWNLELGTWNLEPGTSNKITHAGGFDFFDYIVNKILIKK